MIALVLLLSAADPTPPPAAAPPAAAAVPAQPTAAEIKKVVDYYLHGKDGGPVILEFVACKKVDKNAEGKLACLEPMGASAKKGETITAFVRAFVPKDGKYEDLKVRFLLNGETRSTSDFTVTESLTGYASYKATTASKPGTWEIQVLRGEAQLGSQKVAVE